MVNAWNPTQEKYRLTFNEWIRTSGIPNRIANFDMAVHESDVPTQMLPVYDCGDDLHPSDVGCRYMGDVID